MDMGREGRKERVKEKSDEREGERKRERERASAPYFSLQHAEAFKK